MRVWYNLLKCDYFLTNYDLNIYYPYLLNKSFSILPINHYINKKIIKCYYLLIQKYYSNQDYKIPKKILDDIILLFPNKINEIENDIQLYGYTIYYYTLLIDNNDKILNIIELYPINEEISCLSYYLQLYINNDRLLFDILYINLLFYMKCIFYYILDEYILNNDINLIYHPIIFFNLFLSIFSYNTTDIYNLLCSEDNEIFLLFLLKLLKYLYNNYYKIIDEDLIKLYNKIKIFLNKLSIEYELKDNGFSILDKWIIKNININ